MVEDSLRLAWDAEKLPTQRQEKGRKQDELLQSRARGPSREGPSDGPSGQRPRGEVVGRGDVCPVLCWPVGLLLRICWLLPLLWLLP